jgi:hypothetical protein
MYLLSKHSGDRSQWKFIVRVDYGAFKYSSSVGIYGSLGPKLFKEVLCLIE